MQNRDSDPSYASVDGVVRRWPRTMAGSVFSSPGYYVKGRSFAFWEGGGLVLRLPAEERQHALSRSGARRYTVPRGSATEWVWMPAGDEARAAELLRLLAAAYDFTGGEAPSTPDISC